MMFRKQCVGVDISKDSFDVKFLALPVEGERYKILGSRKFSNNRKGFKEFSTWIAKKAKAGAPLSVVMEATGSYHEELAYFLNDQGIKLSIVLPNKVKAFGRSLNQYSKTDTIDALVIARPGLERYLRLWTPPSKSARQLRHLSRERQVLMKERLRHSNQLHALDHTYGANRNTIRRHKASIKLLAKQIEAIAEEIKLLQKQDPQLAQAMRRLQTIPQVGILTAATVLAETDSFTLFDRREQVVKYAGMDIVERQSGSSINGRSKLSKKGNSRLRGALHMPAIGMIKRDNPFADVYNRVYDRTKCKMKAVVAVQRKLLIVMYALISNKMDYNQDIHEQRISKVGGPLGPPTVTLLAEAGRS